MDKELALWIIGGVALGLGVIGVILVAAAPAAPATTIEPAQESLPTRSSGAFTASDVQFELTPRGVSDGVFTVAFSANTHGITLADYDLTELTTLSYGSVELQPLRASAMTGHHNSGTMEFAVDELPEAFTITITGVPAIEERVFTWGDV